MRLNNIELVTSHGKFPCRFTDDMTISDVMRINEIPWASVSCYAKEPNSEKYILFNDIDTQISDLSNINSLHLFFQRNINPINFQFKNSNSSDASGDENSSYYYFQDIRSDFVARPLLKKMSSEECKKIVENRVHQFIEKHFSPENNKIVLGVSGGGDSNAMLHAFSTFSSFKLDVIPVIVTGLNEWDRGLDRATALCDKYKLTLKVLKQEDVCHIMNFDNSKLSHLEKFESVFPNDDFEGFSVYIIRKCLEHIAKENGINRIAIGANMDDKLSEVIYSIFNNKDPLPFPVRKIGDIDMCYPLWTCTKQIIDGCFPKLSFENYEDRYPSFAPGRAFFYWMAYSIISTSPVFAERLLKFSSKRTVDNIFYDEDLREWVSGSVAIDVRAKLKEMLEK